MKCLLLALAMLLSGTAVAASPEELQKALDDRQALMKDMRAALGGFVPMLKGDKPWAPAEVQRLAGRLREGAARMPTMFPLGTSSDQRFTMALPVIWKDPAGFEATAQAMEKAALRLKDIAPGRDPVALSAQVEVLTNTCLDCHKAYRLNR